MTRMQKIGMYGFALLIACGLSINTVYAKAQSEYFPRERIAERLEKINERSKSTGQAVTYDKNRLEQVYVAAFMAQTNNVEEWLYKSLKDTNYTFEKTDDKHYTVVRRSPAPADPPETTPKNGTLTGKVVDENGTEMPGATVKVVGQKKGTATGLNGDFSLSLPAGNYTVEIAFIGYDTQQVTDVKIEGGKTTPLSISLNTASTQLGEVVVTANYNKSSTAGALRIQQNMPQVSTVMAAEQIGKTSDKNLGEALKRVAGVSTMDNKYVAVRGMGERWNEASLDGVTLPSTETNNKAFSFDLIPTNIIDNVTVVKTSTPDMNANFAGGFVRVVTKDIPEKNFIALQAGASYNSESTGKEQIGRQRGAMDWLGLDDGRRKFPINTIPISKELKEQSYAQSYRFAEMGDNVSTYRSKTPLSQNYQFSFGRVKALGGAGDRWGVIGSFTYRNTQQQHPIEAFERGGWKTDVSQTDEHGDILPEQKDPKGNIYPQKMTATGGNYKYGTVLAGIFNVGYQESKSRLSLRNTYTRKFDNNMLFLQGFNEDYGFSDQEPSRVYMNYPTFQDLLQNKLEGQHFLGKIKLGWMLGHTYVRRNIMDGVNTQETGERIDNELFFELDLGGTDKTFTTRRHYDNTQRDWNWNTSLETSFGIGHNFHTRLKVGYMGAYKRNTYLFEQARYKRIEPYNAALEKDYKKLSVKKKVNPFMMSKYGYVWSIPGYVSADTQYEATVTNHVPFLMFDHRWGSLVRLVWGAKAEGYFYDEISNPYQAEDGLVADSTLTDKKWQWVPSASLTVSPLRNFNIRLAYSRNVVRPQFIERTFFRMYDPVLAGQLVSRGVISTVVDGVDLKLEWYPGVGEVISAGLFYRYLDKPIERQSYMRSSVNQFYILQNSNWAKNTGIELELRKNLAFIADSEILYNLYLYGNASFIRSEVEGLVVEQKVIKDPVTGKETVKEEKKPVAEHRQLYGQVPYMYNVGITYEGEYLGATLSLNRTGHKLNIVGENYGGWKNEYEAARTLMDAQLSYTLPAHGLTFKLNMGNLLNSRTVFYVNNSNDYEKKTESEGGGRTGIFLPGKSASYDKAHDRVTYQYCSGRTFSFSAAWTF